jgi:hypothetical protein
MGSVEVETGTITVIMPGYTVVFDESYGWTIKEATYGGADLLTNTGAMGTTIYHDGAWIGSQHGGEVILSVKLFVDGTEYAVTPGLEVAGDGVAFWKQSQIGPYIHTSRITVSSEGLDENLELLVDEDASLVTKVYALMHCFTIGAREWISFLSNDSEVSGDFVDDDSFPSQTDTDAIALYSPDDDMVIVYSHTPEHTLLWDRAIDKKIYRNPDPPQVADSVISSSCKVRAFRSDEVGWEPTARWLLSLAGAF